MPYLPSGIKETKKKKKVALSCYSVEIEFLYILYANENPNEISCLPKFGLHKFIVYAKVNFEKLNEI